MPALALALALAAAPQLSLAPGPGGCGTPTLTRAGRALPLQGGPVGLCTRALFPARLEAGGWSAVALVEAPHRFDPEVRTRLFVYRLEGTRLVPRFLGSGFPGLDLLAASPADDALLLRVRPRGQPGPERLLRCRFRGFPLACDDDEPAPRSP